MISPVSDNLIFGIVARTSQGRQQLTADALNQRTRHWLNTQEPSAWWIDPHVGITLLRPRVIAVNKVEGREAESAGVLSLRGAISSGGRLAPPTTWLQLDAPRDTATAVLYDILERDSAAINSLRGQFALACWDGRRRRLLLARDHLGQQPFFTRTEPDFFIFCSELVPLMQTVQSGCEINLEAAYWYLSFGMPPPGQTLAHGVERLPAAHLIAWEPGGVPTQQRYWTPLKADAPRTATPEVVNAIQETLDTAIVESCARGEAQGILLSGGTDSTYLAATAASAAGSPLHAFTSAFEESLGMNDDARYAASVAEWLGISHHVVPLHAGKALELLEEVVLAAAEPCGAWASMTHAWLLSNARELGIRRMMTGLGADEIFGGYEHFHTYYVRYLEYLERHPSPPGSDDFENLLLPEDAESRQVIYPGIARFFNENALAEALEEPYRSWQYTSHLRAFYRECRRLKPDAQPIEMMVAHECQHRIPDLLFANFESISRHLGIEVAYPCLDPDVVQLATGLDVLSRYRTPHGDFSRDVDQLQPGFKHALMLVYERRVPEMVLTRPIKTYTAPFGAWFADANFARSIMARLERSRFWERRIIRREWLGHILKQMSVGTQDNQWTFQLWALLTLVGWYDRFVDPPP
ncbi:MAG: hypothetical protein LC803_20125 [Acidobacteria bacterium]|nr:hypothetical protein [Acidobacteriota bacterium]